jgi:flagellar biogenesis protein FliO
MKLADTLLLSLSVVCVIIGIHQTYKNTFASGYLFFMTMLVLMGIYQLRKLNSERKGKEPLNSKKNQKNKHKT